MPELIFFFCATSVIFLFSYFSLLHNRCTPITPIRHIISFEVFALNLFLYVKYLLRYIQGVTKRKEKSKSLFLSWNCNQITILTTNYYLSYSSIYFDNNNSSPMPFNWAEGSSLEKSRIAKNGKLLEYLRKVENQFFTFCDSFMGFRLI